ncbi:hypothetical protein [Fictibacillus gelatini]|uniref:hypothetical protein n=1 Tax=Fictibacillus gelatini TaxID=225985 RepID=UPI0004176BBC|nr:hypothetical protein [Fictibacillus gelatini]
MPDMKELGCGMYLFKPETDPQKVAEAAKQFDEWVRAYFSEYPKEIEETAS